MDKKATMQEQVANVSRDGNPKKELKRYPRDQKHWNKLKNAFGGLTGRLHSAEERLSELEDISIERKTKSRERRLKEKQNRISNCGTITKSSLHIMGILKREKREEGIEEIFEIIMTKNFSKPQFHNAQRTSSRINASPNYGYIVFEL